VLAFARCGPRRGGLDQSLAAGWQLGVLVVILFVPDDDDLAFVDVVEVLPSNVTRRCYPIAESAGSNFINYPERLVGATGIEPVTPPV
jgi:hypothetical protein